MSGNDERPAQTAAEIPAGEGSPEFARKVAVLTERVRTETADLLHRLSKQHGATHIGEPCARWLDAIEAKDEIIRLRARVADLEHELAFGGRIA